MSMWSYFKDTLRWPLIWRRGPFSALVEGLAREMDDAMADIRWLRDQLIAARCDADHVERHGDSRGVRRHRLESEEQFRKRVHRAYAWQLLGGRHTGLPQILAHYGFDGVEVQSLRDEDEERWAEFRLTLPTPEETGLQAEDIELLTWAINESKPARSILAGLRTPQEDQAELGAAGVGTVGLRIDGALDSSVDLEDAPLASAGVAHMSWPVAGYLPSPTAEIDTRDLVSAGVAIMPVYVTGLLPEEVLQ